MDEQIINFPKDLINTDITEWLQKTINEMKDNFIINFNLVEEPVTDLLH